MPCLPIASHTSLQVVPAPPAHCGNNAQPLVDEPIPAPRKREREFDSLMTSSEVTSSNATAARVFRRTQLLPQAKHHGGTTCVLHCASQSRLHLIVDLGAPLKTYVTCWSVSNDGAMQPMDVLEYSTPHALPAFTFTCSRYQPKKRVRV